MSAPTTSTIRFCFISICTSTAAKGKQSCLTCSEILAEMWKANQADEMERFAHPQELVDHITEDPDRLLTFGEQRANRIRAWRQIQATKRAKKVANLATAVLPI